MPMGPLMYSIAAQNPRDKTWILVQEADAVMTTLAFFGATMRSSGGDPSSPWAGQDALRVLKSLHQLTETGKFIWPHPELMTMGARKSVNTVLYGQSMVDVSGVGEAPVVVTSKKMGIQMLTAGSHVIKSDWSFEYSNIFMPTTSLGKSGRGARSVERPPIELFREAWDRVVSSPEDPFAPVFLAVPYNDAIISLGEVRVYIVNGKIVDMLHTTPGVIEATAWNVQRVSAARTAPVNNIKCVPCQFTNQRDSPLSDYPKTISPGGILCQIVQLVGSTASLRTLTLPRPKSVNSLPRCTSDLSTWRCLPLVLCIELTGFTHVLTLHSFGWPTAPFVSR